MILNLAETRVTPQAILLVEDDASFAAELSEFLERHGLAVGWRPSLAGLAGQVAASPPLLIVLDQFVGRQDSLTVLPDLRKVFAGGIMILTGNQEIADRIVALETGADDFISKTVEPREILARVRALLRRTQASAPPAVAGRWRINERRQEVRAPNGAVLPLTRTEFLALHLMLRSAGQFVTRDELSLAVLGRPFSPLDRSVDNLVSRIRRALEPHLAGQAAISPVRGKGYVLDAFTPADIDINAS
jgi:DNA-binding response OmpR family regulator